ncbi:CAP domain-containing protein [Paraconexibacter algicola]|uniref:SCP domain-containing protein n=1 Tax=Paraconexibacter algicola TaxID=2133960 RepID=A0A2T4UEV5_9ACTN|nr:CAP domain-containing protein [Paraconexibacter algicola]PTL56318.1 hypothetical protein C7Y72_15205 [Paraconexibacter algicola]
MPKLPRTSRAAVICALVASAAALLPSPARAADAILPSLPICLDTVVLPPIGTCVPAPTPTPSPTPAPEEPAPTPPASPGRCADRNLQPTAATIARVERATLCLLNRERTKRGRARLRAQPTLAGVADRYAAQMVREGFFAHVSPAGTTMLARIRRTGYLEGDIARWSVGENLAWGTGRISTPARIVKAWMASPGHKRNILDRSYREIGVGVVLGVPEDPSRGATYVTEFGHRVRR